MANVRWHGKSSSISARHGGLEIDIDALVRIAEYFRFRWDPPILAELAERASRFRALASRLETHVGEHVDDNALSRSLHRLTRTGLITADCTQVGRRDYKLYRPTGKGHQHVKTYAAVTTAYTHLDQPEHGRCDGCCLHGPQRTDRDA